ncbi:HAD-IA family hydrolase [Arenibaculum pallidiluteum]|uniref:HAD-IA family hydrolase n=1 Tax=Arenibaculum pallidiluteum TaxID=2812559 RepID=UPI001A97346F|nr:HAD-IA family hydrolase [Arenibaculum pallidiluteum]
MTDLRLALFDCDGTLVDSQHAIVASMTDAWRAEGLGDPDPAAVRRLVGLPLVEAAAQLLPLGDAALHERIALHYKDAFRARRERGDLPEPLFPGLREALDRVEASGILMGIATGKSRRGLLATLEHHGLLHRFVTLQTADLGPGKPHPDMVNRAMAETGAEPWATLVIGDTTYDMHMARNARVGAVGVAWGYHEPSELWTAGAQRVCADWAEVPDAIATVLAATEDLGSKE